ncbi:MAG: hypothetical protein MMC33_008350 [Icmadophila ericetorum]|nr:hypothetical protein [Icmadophila ericetorum]
MLRPKDVEVLILGAGWTSEFLIDLLKENAISYAATHTTDRDKDKDGERTITFKFDPASKDVEPYKKLPAATTVLITFPLVGHGQSKHLVELYDTAHGWGSEQRQWIQLGSTGIFTAPHWNDHSSPYDRSDSRAIAEDELLALGGTVLNLAGLYGGKRDPHTWVKRVARTKEAVKGKKALHLIYGGDVARGILGCHLNWKKVEKRRWLLTDLRVYDWWDLIQAWGAGMKSDVEGEEDLEYEKWVGELMVEERVRSLPRSPEVLERVLDSRAFWEALGIWPVYGRAK